MRSILASLSTFCESVNIWAHSWEALPPNHSQLGRRTPLFPQSLTDAKRTQSLTFGCRDVLVARPAIDKDNLSDLAPACGALHEDDAADRRRDRLAGRLRADFGAQVPSRPSAACALLACTVQKLPLWPVFIAWISSIAASPLWTSPRTSRSGRQRSGSCTSAHAHLSRGTSCCRHLPIGLYHIRCAVYNPSDRPYCQLDLAESSDGCRSGGSALHWFSA